MSTFTERCTKNRLNENIKTSWSNFAVCIYTLHGFKTPGHMTRAGLSTFEDRKRMIQMHLIDKQINLTSIKYIKVFVSYCIETFFNIERGRGELKTKKYYVS